MDNYDFIMQDLQQIDETARPVIPLHNQDEDPKSQVKYLLKQLRRAKSMNNRREMLITAWYIGEAIETKTTSLTERVLCLKLMSQYYQKVVIRLYYIFEFLGVEVLNCSTDTTLTMISKLSNSQYMTLQQEAVTVAGARL